MTVACFSPEGQTGATTGEPTSTGDEGAATESTVAPTAGSTSEVTNPTTPGTASATSDTATSLTPTTGSDCGVCPDSLPYCGPAGECVDCIGLGEQGGSCSDVAPGQPVCGAAGLCVECILSTDCSSGVCDEQGQCVACIGAIDCPGNLACDPDTHTCIHCSEHADCPDTACQLDVGTCFPQDSGHWYVRGPKLCGGTLCTVDAPCCEIDAAFAALKAAAGDFHVVHVAAGDYIAPFHLDVPGRVAVLAAPKAHLSVGAAGQSAVRVGSAGNDAVDAKLFLAGLRVGGLGDVAFSCTRANLAWLDDVEVVDFFGNSLYATDCEVTVRRSRFLGNTGGLGVALDGLLRLENSVVSGITTSATLLVQGGELDLLYSTVTLQHPVAGGLLYCLGGSAAIRNSVVVSDQGGLPQIDCMAPVEVTHSLTSEDELLMGSTVEHVDPVDLALQFVDFAGHDLRPIQDGALRDVAAWQEGDPRTDIAGQPRPTRPGPDYAGAHEP